MQEITVKPHIPAQKIETYLKKYESLPLSLIFRLLRHRQIKINGQRGRQGMYIQPGDIITLPEKSKTVITDGPLMPTGFLKKNWKILFEDDHLLAVNKEADIAMHPAHNIEYTKTLLAVAEDYAKEHGFTIYMVHRLDRFTSGVVLFAKNAETREKLQTLFANRKIEKVYLAVVQGKVALTGTINKPVPNKWDTKNKKAVTMLPALTNYERLQVIKVPFAPHIASVVAAYPKTGKLHQIRRHFAMIGHPIIGDARYGNFNTNRSFRKFFKITRHFLHAARINFVHPITQKMMEIEAPLPKDLTTALSRLSKYVSTQETVKHTRGAKHGRPRK